MPRFRLAIAILLLLCLPLKVVAAVAMPFCGDAGVPATAQATSHMHHADVADHGAMPAHADGPDATPSSHSPADHDGDCNQCGLCHLACTPALPLAVSELEDHLSDVLQADSPPARSSVTGSRLFRPPLSSRL